METCPNVSSTSNMMHKLSQVGMFLRSTNYVTCQGHSLFAESSSLPSLSDRTGHHVGHPGAGSDTGMMSTVWPH